MIAANGDRQGAGGADLADRRFGPPVVAAGGIAGDIADIDHLDVLSVEQGPANVEIITVEPETDALRGAPNRGRRVGLVVDQLIDRVGTAIRHADDGDIGLQRIEILDQREVQECLEDVARRCGEVGHAVSSVAPPTVQACASAAIAATQRNTAPRWLRVSPATVRPLA
jgi:hypothetical protein